MSTTYVSYASEYDLYEGSISVAELTVGVQDELIRAVLGTSHDFREIAVTHDVIKAQTEGLWTIVVLLGMALERDRKISNFEERTEDEVALLVASISGTKLWLRLEEAYPPFNFREERTEYDWSELEPLQMEELSEVAGESLLEVKHALFKKLKSRPLIFKPNRDDRMPYHAFRPLYDQGKVILFVDRSLAPVAGASGVVKSAAPTYIALSVAALVAAPAVWFFFGFLFSLPLFILAIALFRGSFGKTIMSVRQAAINDKEKYRWLMSRRVIWLQTK